MVNGYCGHYNRCSVYNSLWSQHYIFPAIVTEGVLGLGMNCQYFFNINTRRMDMLMFV